MDTRKKIIVGAIVLATLGSIMSGFGILYSSIMSQTPTGIAIREKYIDLEKEEQKTAQMREVTRQLELQQDSNRRTTNIYIPPPGAVRNPNPYVYQDAKYPPNHVYQDAKY